MVTRVFQLLLLISPICVTANIDMVMFDIIFFRTGILLLLFSTLFDKPIREVPEWVKTLIRYLGILVVANVCIHTFQPISMHESFNLFLAVTGFCVVYTHLRDFKSIQSYIMWAGAINLLFFICQKIGFDPVWDVTPYKGQEGACLGNQPILMTYFALLLPLFPSYLTALLGISLGLYTHQTVIFVPVAIILFSKMKTKRERIGITILFLLGLYYLRTAIFKSLSFRMNMGWTPTLKTLFDQSLIGIGLGERPTPEVEVIWSSYLQFIVGVGILGAVWFGTVFKSVYKKLRNVREHLALISLAMVMSFEYPLEIPRLRYLIIAILVAALIKMEEPCGS